MDTLKIFLGEYAVSGATPTPAKTNLRDIDPEAQSQDEVGYPLPHGQDLIRGQTDTARLMDSSEFVNSRTVPYNSGAWQAPETTTVH